MSCKCNCDKPDDTTYVYGVRLYGGKVEESFGSDSKWYATGAAENISNILTTWGIPTVYHPQVVRRPLVKGEWEAVPNE